MYNFFDFYNTEPVKLFSRPQTLMRIHLNVLSHKLLNKNFPHVEIFDHEEIEKGATVEVFYQNRSLGTARVVAVRRIPFIRLSDIVTLLDSNLTVQQYAAMMIRRHGPIDADQDVAHIVLSWIQHDTNQIAYLLNSGRA